MVEVIVLIPLAGNDGQRFSADHHRVFEQVLTETFEGMSRLPGIIWGVWLDEGTRYDDANVAYLLVLKSITDGGKLGGVIDFAKRHYQQEAIFLRYLGVVEIV